MPLHLLGKKSWNVYAPDNIERVRKDEAAAAAREEEHEQRMQEEDAARRRAILRGEEPPPLTVEAAADDADNRQLIRRESRKESGGRERKRRRVAGEDDTARDIRYAREDAEAAASRDEAYKKRSHRSESVPITDFAGHINLFAADERALRPSRPSREQEAEARKKRKEKEIEDRITMRFSNAAGRDGAALAPWYASSVPSVPPKQPDGGQEPKLLGSVEEVGKDVWGNPDPRRKDREKVRVSTNDPLAFMKRAQTKLRESEQNRERWKQQRAEEVEGSHEAERRRQHRKRDSNNDLEEFSLDSTHAPRSSRSDRHRHSSHRSSHRKHHRSRSPDDEDRHRHRSSHRDSRRDG